ncbi:VOC family protein [Streptomyces minutiscleroticus]|uniref:VOC family protein n=1 Tax=Streptomyces minutiscleroticus TaxID=68238 RepID=UPI00167E3F2E|nr:VOC family protein [Streptomyces minutiscleroticus]
MRPKPRSSLSATVRDAPDAGAPASFRRALLGRSVQEEGPDRVALTPPEGGAGLSFRTERPCTRPRWSTVPVGRHEQQMTLCLDIRLDDLPAAVGHAVAPGATPAGHQFQGHVRVLHDPVGHPFRLLVEEEE